MYVIDINFILKAVVIKYSSTYDFRKLTLWKPMEALSTNFYFVQLSMFLLRLSKVKG